MSRKQKRLYLLLGLLGLIALSIFFLENTKTIAKDKNYDIKVHAAEIMEQSIAAVRTEKLARGLPIDLTVDYNDTGIIGEGYTYMTTTLGSPEAKRTSANPDMAAMIVDMLDEAGVKKGDRIAANFSGSFPALNIATLSACEAMGVTPIVISSAGASTYGANLEDFIYLEMEQLIYDLGLVSHKSVAASVGGVDDIGKEMPPEVSEKIRTKIHNAGIIFIEEPDFSKNLETRLGIYDSYGEYTCFINVGGNRMSANSDDMINLSGGVQRRKNSTINEKSGLLEVFMHRGLPAIQLLNVKDLAIRYHIPVDPIGFGTVGEGAVYHTYQYHRIAVMLVLLVILVVLMLYRKGLGKYERDTK